MPLRRLPAFRWRSRGALILAVATAALGLPAAASVEQAQAASTTCSSTPFTSTSKYRYRLPAVVKTDSGRLFIFAEKRNNNYDNNDDGDFDIVMRTSTDGGCSWTPMKTVVNYGKNRVSNPVPIYDQRNNQVLLFSTVKLSSGNKLYLQRFYADGSKVRGSGLVTVTNWLPGLTGPGHGLVLTTGSHKGRIIFAMGYTRNKENSRRATRGIYSDDGGATWTVGYDQAGSGSLQLIEGTIAELPDGRLLVSYRDNGKGVTKPGANRVSAISEDGGANVGAYTAMSGVKTVPVEGSLLQLTGSSSNLLFSSPSWTAGKLTSRRGMRIFVSTDSGQSWRSGLAIGGTTDPACYSDLVQIDDATVGIAYESGYTHYWKRIVFRQVRTSSIANSLLPKLVKAAGPSISGSYKVGKTLTAGAGRWAPSSFVPSYQWLRSGKAIASATGSSYKLVKKDKGKKISVKVTVSTVGYQATSATTSAHTIH